MLLSVIILRSLSPVCNAADVGTALAFCTLEGMWAVNFFAPPLFPLTGWQGLAGPLDEPPPAGPLEPPPGAGPTRSAALAGAFPCLRAFYAAFADLPRNGPYLSSPLHRLPFNNKAARFGSGVPDGARFDPAAAPVGDADGLY